MLASGPGSMRSSVVSKVRDGWAVTPNMPDYERERASFPWDIARQGSMACHASGKSKEALSDLVARARTGRLRSSEMSDPTITVANLGYRGVGTVFGVIYPPQVALVGLGAVIPRESAGRRESTAPASHGLGPRNTRARGGARRRCCAAQGAG
jgi:hypothetical protein